MGSIEVDGIGLSALTAHCNEQATRVAAAAALPLWANKFQPTAVAVQAAQVNVTTTCARLAARMQATASAADAAASSYVSAEAMAARSIAALGDAGTTAV